MLQKEINLGKRRIQKIRHSQFINLPKVWTENNQTKQGDVVEITLEKDGSLKLKFVPVVEASQAKTTGTASTEGAPA